MTWDEVADRIAGGALAVLPVGAAAKQHGLHLPLDTDLIQAEWLAERVAAVADALIWPAVSYGHYPAFTAYAGSISLSAATFEAMIAEIVGQILGFGCARLLVLDTGLSTIGPIDRALAALAPDRVLHLCVHQGPCYRAAQALAKRDRGSHADQLETSIMLALAPDLVDMSRAEASPAGRGHADGPLTPADPQAPNYSPSGSYGDPREATRAEGARLLAAMTRDVVEAALRFAAGAQVARPS